MFNSVVLDVAVGLIFTFLTVSLVCGLLTEVWATVMSWRANTLLAGVQALVNDSGFNKLAQALYRHALVSPRDDGSAATVGALKNKPSYIDPLHFADAMLDNLKVAGGTAAQMKAAIAASPLVQGDTQMTTMLTGMADRADGDVNKLRNSIAGWFDAGMDRVSGSYKRRTQCFCFGFGLLIAVALNIDSLQVARALWQQPQITHAVTTTMDPGAALTQVDAMKLPIGWAADGSQCPGTILGWAARLLGWAITALSTLFGATFWFDALSGVLKIRGSGPSPDAAA
ncbi:MAG TPA: hypothetical protein VGG99_10715 [Acetobacteraceae bacterium]|jgi:hypothetical protein